MNFGKSLEAKKKKKKRVNAKKVYSPTPTKRDVERTVLCHFGDITFPSFGNGSENRARNLLDVLFPRASTNPERAWRVSRERARVRNEKRPQVGVSWPESLIIASIVVVNVRHCAANGL